MSMPITVRPQARDVQFEFQDSCNCCCFGWRRPSPTTSVIVTRSGSVERMRARSNSDEERRKIQETLQNIQAVLVALAEKQQKDQEQVLRQVAELSGVSLTGSQKMTLDQLAKINLAIKTVFG